MPATKKDVTENGAIVELIGPFPYFINFQPLDGEQLVPLIEKSTQKRWKNIDKYKIGVVASNDWVFKGKL